MAVKPKPDGYHTATPYLIIQGAAKAIEFYKQAFEATELMRLEVPGGTIRHAEIKIGDSIIMLADEHLGMDVRSPQALGGTPVCLMLYVEDSDAMFAQAIAAGGTAQKPIQDQFYGDRSGQLIDPFGHVWTISTHKEDLTPAEIEARLTGMVTQRGSEC